MRTIKSISTVSYNSDSFLAEKLNELIAEKKIEFWAFINHLPEEDEKKAHKHVYIIPACLLDTFAIQERLREYDVSKPDEPPLGCISFVSSKFVDWYFYALHDKDYLISKNQTRVFHYDSSEIFCSDSDRLSELIHMSDTTFFKKFAKFRESVDSGLSFNELLRNGFVPIQQIIQWNKAYKALKYGDLNFDERTFRAGRSGHDDNEYVFDGSAVGGVRGGTSCAPEASANVDASKNISKSVTFGNDRYGIPKPFVNSDGEIIGNFKTCYDDELPFQGKKSDSP